MINLLSPNDRKQLAAARTNTLLLRYNVLLGLVIVLLIAEMVGIYFVLGMDKANNEATIADNDAKTQSYASTKQAAASFKADLTTAKAILDNQVTYTKLITTIAGLLPSDVAIDTLALNPSTFGTPTQMTIHTKSYQSAIDVKQNLQDSKLFNDVNFQSVTQNTDSSDRPFTAVYNVTFSKEAAKL